LNYNIKILVGRYILIYTTILFI